jgi:hypothetical protein
LETDKVHKTTGRNHITKTINQPGVPPGEYQPMSFGGKNMKRRREKGGKCQRKRKNRENKLEKAK